MRTIMIVLANLSVAILLAGCTRPVQQAASTGSVTGDVIYTVQTDLPDDALVTVQLHDVTAGAGDSTLVNQQQIATNGNPPPYAFGVPFPPAGIDQSHAYGLMAFIQDAAGHIIFRSDAVVPVLTQGNSMAGIEVPVMPVDRNPGVSTEQEQALASGLIGELWEVVSLNGDPPAADTTITAQFGEDGALSGSNGCNSYSATYAVDGAAITIQPGASTAMACPEPAMTQATDYMAALAAATRYAIDGGMLTLADAGGATLLTYRVVEQSLAGASWEAILFNDGAAVVSATGVQITVAFSADGQLSGFGGCNEYAATYTTGAANAIQIDPLVATQKACTEPANVMEQESQYFVALQSAMVYQAQGELLEMQNGNGQIAVQFQRTRGQGASPAAAPPIDPDIYNKMPATTVFAPGQCSVILDAPAPAYTSNTLGGQSSGEIAAGIYAVGVAADYDSSLWYGLNDLGATSYINSTSVTATEGDCSTGAK